jgi:23S rRNA pseudouridine1911/1915/1917 synthase
MKLTIRPTDNHIGKRLDVIISELIEDLSRSQVQKLINRGNVTVNGCIVVDASRKVQASCEVDIELRSLEQHDHEIEPENIGLNVVFEDDHIIIINKDAGMVCHPAPGHRSHTLVNALKFHFASLSDVSGNARPGMVHRLDKDTSGLLLIAKTNKAHQAFANLFANDKGRLIFRRYTCFVFGVPFARAGTIDTYLTRHPKLRQQYMVSSSEGKRAITNYSLKKSRYFTATKSISRVTCDLLTGRTHQIRVHMKHAGCPIIGDQTYGRQKIEPTYPEEIRNFGRQALHSNALSFTHPFEGREMSFEAPLPTDMQILQAFL